MRRRWLPTAVAAGIAIVSLVLLGILASGIGHGALEKTPDPIVGKPAPSFSLRALDGRTISLRSLRGHPVVLNFWASWCTTCPTDHASLRTIWNRFKHRGVRFVGVMYEDTASGARSFLRKHGGGWPVVDDSDGQVGVEYGLTGIPETYVIDSRGIVRFHANTPIAPNSAMPPTLVDSRIQKLLRAA